jgi:hypothetical protein
LVISMAARNVILIRITHVVYEGAPVMTKSVNLDITIEVCLRYEEGSQLFRASFPWQTHQIN